MEWLYLFIAGVFEIGWPLGFKLSQVQAENKWLWIIMAVISMALSGFYGLPSGIYPSERLMRYGRALVPAGHS